MLARYYSSGLARFMAVDAITIKMERLINPQALNLYAYALNNPILFIDVTGEETSVFYVEAGEGNKSKWGHAAVHVQTDTFSGGIRQGGAHGFENGKEGFIAGYTGDGREVTEFKLNLTPEQEEALASFIDGNPDGGVDTEKMTATLACKDNCTTAVGDALKASGAIPAGETPPGKGVIADTPSDLKSDLEKGGDNHKLVKETVVHEPQHKEE